MVIFIAGLGVNIYASVKEEWYDKYNKVFKPHIFCILYGRYKNTNYVIYNKIERVLDYKIKETGYCLSGKL